jgi:hypothetical protein
MRRTPQARRTGPTTTRPNDFSTLFNAFNLLGNEMQIRQITRRAGRPRLLDRKRDASGRSRGESPAEIVAVARAQRIKAGADPDDALDALNGSTLGILHRRWQMCATDPSGISADQYNAAQLYISCVIRYCEIMGIPLPRPNAARAGATRGDPPEEVVLAVRRRFADLRRTLLDCGREIGVGSRVNAAVYRICIEDPPLDAVQPPEIENLRYGLNAVARHLR